MHISNYHKLHRAMTTLCILDPLFSSSVLLNCMPWTRAGFWLCWHTGAAPIWKAVNPASKIRILVLSPLNYLSVLMRFGYILICLMICHAVHFQEKLFLLSPHVRSIWSFSLQPFIGWNDISLKKVLNKANEPCLSPNMTWIGVTESPADLRQL